MSDTKKPVCIVVCGATASGKTALAIELAHKYHTAVLSADSRQCYQEMNIGVARPSGNELAAAKHYFIATHSITEEVNAASYEKYALEKAAEVWKKSDYLVVSGGTGLYLKAFCEGLDDIPSPPEHIQQEVRAMYAAGGLPLLLEKLKKEDPDYYATGEVQNPHRVMRALEVVRASGKSIRGFQRREPRVRPFSIHAFAIDLPRDLLYERINQRVDLMMEAGLLEEVERLLPHKHRSALQTVGYQELFDHLEGKTTLERAVELIKQHTRHYAKRQLTWFRKNPAIQWVSPNRFHTIPELIKA